MKLNTKFTGSSRAETRLIRAAIAAALIATVSRESFATTYYYKGSGNLNAASSWTDKRDGTGTAASGFTTAGNTFVIQNNQSPTLQASATWTISGSGSGLLVESGGSMNSGANNPTLPLSLESGATYTSPNTTYSNLSFGTVNASSNFIVSGSLSTLIDRAYGNLFFRSSGSTLTPSNDITTTGSLTIDSSTAPLRVATGSSTRTWTIGNSLNITSGSTWGLTAATSGTATTNIANGLTNDGTISKPGSTGIVAVNFTGTGSSDVKWGTVNNANFSTATFTVNASKTIVFTDSLDEGAASFVVNGTLNLGSQVLSGTLGNFNLGSGGSLITANATGLDGALTVTGTKSFNSAANYEFRGAATGALLPTTVNNLTINRSSGDVTLNGSGSTETVSGALNIYSGSLNAGATRNTVNASSIVMRAGQINSNVTTNVSGPVSFDAVNNGTATIAGALGLGAATRTFTIGDGTAAVDMSVTGNITNGGLTKSGAGTLALSGGNGYTGPTTISLGTLQLGVGGSTGTLSTSSTITDNANLTINRNNAVAQGTDFSGSAITGSGSLTQAGSGTTTLGTANTYSGGTTISSGIILANGARTSGGPGVTSSSATGKGKVSINSGGMLAGTGGTGAVDVNGGGFITAGSGAALPAAPTGLSADTIGTLRTGAQTWKADATTAGTYRAKVNALAAGGTQNDLLVIDGSLNLSLTGGGKFNIVLLKSANYTEGIFNTTSPTLLTLATATTITNGATTYTDGSDLTSLFTLDTSNLGIADVTYKVFADSTGGGFAVDVQMTPTPEPTTAALIGLGGSVLLGRRRRSAGAGWLRKAWGMGRAKAAAPEAQSGIPLPA